MGVIINPNEPPAMQEANSELNKILDTMRIIGEFRKAYFLLEKQKEKEGLTEKHKEEICDSQEHVCVNMVRFIIEGKLPNE